MARSTGALISNQFFVVVVLLVHKIGGGGGALILNFGRGGATKKSRISGS